MAATVVSSRVLTAGAGGVFRSEMKLSGLTAGLPEQVAHLGPTGRTPSRVYAIITEPPTDGSLSNFVFDDTDTTNDKVEFRFMCAAGGSLDGMTATVYCEFLDQANGGLNPP